MPYELILAETYGQVGLITINRPQAMNALNNQLMRELMDALEAFDENDGIGAMVIAGNEKAFAAGADIKEMADRTIQQMMDRDHVAVFGRIRTIRKPVIAAVSGWALGAGFEIALSCDMIVASESAKFGLPRSRSVLSRRGRYATTHACLGKVLAMEMILNNRTLSAQEAMGFGLVNRVVPVSDFLNEALKLAEEDRCARPFGCTRRKEDDQSVLRTFSQ
jgi:enoyl-CoA hydratase